MIIFICGALALGSTIWGCTEFIKGNGHQKKHQKKTKAINQAIALIQNGNTSDAQKLLEETESE